MTDESIMPFGKHQGKKLINVPDEYFMWFWKANKDIYLSASPTLSYHGKQIMKYIEDSFNHNELE